MEWNYDLPDDQAIVLAECAAFYREALNDTQASLQIWEGLGAALPASSNVQMELGHTSYRAGNLARSREHLEKAIDLNSRNALAHAHLAVVELAEGNRDAAVRLWNDAIELDTDPETGELGPAGTFARARWAAENATQAFRESKET